MKQFILKSRMLFLICFMSTVILGLACNAAFPVPVKDLELLSDQYLTVEFQQAAPLMAELNDWMEVNHCPLMTGYIFSNGKTAVFDKKLIDFLELDTRCLENMKQEENTALVNREAQMLCYERNGKNYLPFQGTDYRIIGTYSQEETDSGNRTDYILNQKAAAIQESDYYTYVFLDPGNETDRDRIVNSFRRRFPGAVLSEWRGGLSGNLDARPALALLLVVCGCILCLNCIGYSGAWIQSQKKEFAVRRLVGASDNQNHFLLLKRFIGIWLGAYVPGILATGILLAFLNRNEKLEATRRLLGNHLDIRSVMLAGAAVLLMGILVTEISIAGEKRRSVLLGVRGDRI